MMPEEGVNMINMIFKDFSKGLRKLLKQMLIFNPNERLSAKDLISSPYFDSCRNLSQEQDAEFEIKVAVDEENAFNYSTFQDTFSIDDYKNLIS